MLTGRHMSGYLRARPACVDPEDYLSTLLRRPHVDAASAQSSLIVKALRVSSPQTSDGNYVVARLLIEDTVSGMIGGNEEPATRKTPQLLAELLAIRALTRHSGVRYSDMKVKEALASYREGELPQFAITLGRISTEILGDRPPVVAIDTSSLPESVALQRLSIYPPLEGEPPGITLC